VNDRRSLDDVQQRIRTHLLPAFAGRQLASITAGDVREYQKRRRLAGAANGTINREIALMKRSFALAIADGKLFTKPTFAMLEESAPRQGFFEPEQLDAVLSHLPEALRPMIRFAAITGWRIPSEVQTLTWRQVDFDAGTVTTGRTKNGEIRVFPMPQDLRDLLVAQRATVDAIQRERGMVVPFVFVWEDGRRVRSFWASWRKAVVAAGCPGRVPHDLRRTAVRHFDRSGIPVAWRCS
jgi:integrase